MSFPVVRPRRLRRTALIRDMVRETRLHRDQLIYPLFIVPGTGIKNEIKGFEGVYHHSVDRMVDTCRHAADELGLPCFAYGPERTLPDVRRGAFSDLAPTTGPAAPHPTAGAVAVGARPLLVAYNVWLAEPDLAAAKRIAVEVRSPSVRALGLQVGEHVQVSMNLIDPAVTGPGAATDAVAAHAEVARTELVGLVPRWVLDLEPVERWGELDLDEDRTIEARVRRWRPRPTT